MCAGKVVSVKGAWGKYYFGIVGAFGSWLGEITFWVCDA